ncbi:MAG: bis(5'-nucleosyl)-tetraphosphatase [Bdellovibrionota bacterium]
MKERSNTSPSPKTLSAGIIPVRRDGNRWLFLLLRSYAYWDFPKGMVEENEDPLSAALRELKEETGLARAQVRWGEDYYETAPYSRGKVARYFLAEVFNAQVELLPNPDNGIVEHHGFRWLSYEDAKLLVVPRVRGALNWAQRKITPLPGRSG